MMQSDVPFFREPKGRRQRPQVVLSRGESMPVALGLPGEVLIQGRDGCGGLLFERKGAGTRAKTRGEQWQGGSRVFDFTPGSSQGIINIARCDGADARLQGNF